MDASEAYKRTQESLTGPAIESYVKWIDSMIETAIANGLFSICRPFMGYPETPSFNIRDAVFDYYRNKGYNVIAHAGDQRDPRGSDHHEISWKNPIK